MNNATNHTLDGPAFTLTGVRLTWLGVKLVFLRTLDLGIGTSAFAGRLFANEISPVAPRAEKGEVMPQTERRSGWRFGVPVVCVLAGLLLGATHGVSGG